MKMIRVGFACWLLCMCFAGMAQRGQPHKKFAFSSINTAGILFGESKYAPSFQTVNGVRYKSWFAGAGVALDYYQIRSVPVFVDVRKIFIQGKNPLFVYGDAGVNIPWLKDVEKETFWYASDHNSGFYYDAGAGVEFKMKRGAVVVSAGYTSKQMQEIRTYPYIWGPPGLPDRKETFDYTFHRLVLKAGLRF